MFSSSRPELPTSVMTPASHTLSRFKHGPGVRAHAAGFLKALCRGVTGLHLPLLYGKRGHFLASCSAIKRLSMKTEVRVSQISVTHPLQCPLLRATLFLSRGTYEPAVLVDSGRTPTSSVGRQLTRWG